MNELRNGASGETARPDRTDDISEESALPRPGVRPGLPIVYAAHSPAMEILYPHSQLADHLGAPPVSAEMPSAERASLPSIARQNRRFRLLALLGGVVVVVVVVGGLWGLTRLV